MKRGRLDDLEPVYVWADGIYVNAGLEKDKAAMLVVIAALRDGRKVVPGECELETPEWRNVRWSRASSAE